MVGELKAYLEPRTVRHDIAPHSRGDLSKIIRGVQRRDTEVTPYKGFMNKSG